MDTDAELAASCLAWLEIGCPSGRRAAPGLARGGKVGCPPIPAGFDGRVSSPEASSDLRETEPAGVTARWPTRKPQCSISFPLPWPAEGWGRWSPCSALHPRGEPQWSPQPLPGPAPSWGAQTEPPASSRPCTPVGSPGCGLLPLPDNVCVRRVLGAHPRT